MRSAEEWSGILFGYGEAAPVGGPRWIRQIQREAFDAGAAAMRAKTLNHEMDAHGQRWVFAHDVDGIEIEQLEGRP